MYAVERAESELFVRDFAQGAVDPGVGELGVVAELELPGLAVDAREGAEDLFHSLRRLLELEDGVETYPGHVAGSLCGKAIGKETFTTIGEQRRANYALQPMSREAFVPGVLLALARLETLPPGLTVGLDALLD